MHERWDEKEDGRDVYCKVDAVRLRFGWCNDFFGALVVSLWAGLGLCLYCLSTSCLPFFLPRHPFAVAFSCLSGRGKEL